MDKREQQLSERLQKALKSGDTETAIKVTGQLEAHLRRRTQQVVPPDGVMAFAAAPSVMTVRKTPRSSSPARQSVTASLSEIGVPARAKLVSDYAFARFGERVEPRAFAALRRDERRAWGSKSPRPTYVVPALEGRFYQPIRGLLALSDWPLERRLIGPWSERTDHLAATAQLARQLAWLSERDEDAAERLAPLVASMARSIPGAMDGREVDTARVEEAAEAEREALASRDEPWRKDAAARARNQLGAEQQLWGASVVVISGDGAGGR